VLLRIADGRGINQGEFSIFDNLISVYRFLVVNEEFYQHYILEIFFSGKFLRPLFFRKLVLVRLESYKLITKV